MSDMAVILNPMARAIFSIALRDDRCGELLDHLFNGGGVTIDAATGRLVLIPADFILEAGAEIEDAS